MAPHSGHRPPDSAARTIRLLAPPLAVLVVLLLGTLAARTGGSGVTPDSPGHGDLPASASTLAHAAAPVAVERAVAVTIDDVPGVATTADPCDAAALTDLNERLLASLARQRVPATAFVVGSRVCAARRDSLLPELLGRWLSGGHVLGNHTFSHRDLNAVSLEWYLADAERNERLLETAARAGAAAVPGGTAQGDGDGTPAERIRWFRPPLLHTGDSRTKRVGLTAGLAERGYRMGPVTVDNQEWIFADVYTRAKAAADSAVMARVASAYIPFMASVFEFFEERSRVVLGREIPQVLLLHANDLNADHFDALADMLRSRGYRFVSLAEAMEDTAYARPDPYVGPRGLSWIHRWGLAEGIPVALEPREPEWLSRLRREYRPPAPH